MDKIDVRVELEGEIASKFLAIKKGYGLKNNTEVIRQLITSAHEGSFTAQKPKIAEASAQ